MTKIALMFVGLGIIFVGLTIAIINSAPYLALGTIVLGLLFFLGSEEEEEPKNKDNK